MSGVVGLPQDLSQATNLWPPAIAAVLREQCTRLGFDERSVLRHAGLHQRFIDDAAQSLYTPRHGQLALAAQVLGIEVSEITQLAVARVRRWARMQESSHGEPRMSVTALGGLLAHRARRHALILCSVVPEFTATDLVVALGCSGRDADAIVTRLCDEHAIRVVPGPDSVTTYAVVHGVREVFLAVVRGGFVETEAGLGADRP